MEPVYEEAHYSGFGSALRRADLLGLRWKRVGLLDGTVTVAETWTRDAFDTPKSEASYRTVALGSVALQARGPSGRASGFREDEDIVFTIQTSGRRSTRRS